ncbi:putative flavin-binding monooxygenase [Talaromyces proteolyticus]|uniref:Flavin-binding monooxygenase n=1 Tax=Talaromyces proteolyticus TaxID=1131652 RepID=A0AAD4KW12_9EURO|nr:putative flavin-binding monooxygenase [Talaromyces proteolyticus]KAH8701064.1 putative flavin-binding monooxygenase [Talaromyces proteolyticus]
MTSNMPNTATTTFDIIIVGAGLGGINAAYRLQKQLPHLSYAILESRDEIGGTWDLFRYPGIRSDSDLHTFGFAWKPWDQPSPIGQGAEILDYMKEGAAQHGIDQHIHLSRRLRSASWSSGKQRWTLTVDDKSNGETKKTLYFARFILLCTGYFNHDQALETEIPGLENFKGQVVHPQFWPEDLDYTDKRVVVIGSGATAITLVPALAEKAALTTMLQRSPSYVVEIPSNRAGRGSWLSRLLPTWMVHSWRRLTSMLWSRYIFLTCQAYPDKARKRLIGMLEGKLPPHLPIDPHFSPSYYPYDQRVTLTPDGVFFKCLRSGKADVKTAVIKNVVADGIQVINADSKDSPDKHDQFIPADIIVTATGLKLRLAGGATFDVDGKPVNPSNQLLWMGSMLQGMPNLGLLLGYTSISYTLGLDAAVLIFCRVVRMMERKRMATVTPRVEPGVTLSLKPYDNLTATYVLKGIDVPPKVADKAPWLPRSSILSDYWAAHFGRIDKCLDMVKAEDSQKKKTS